MSTETSGDWTCEMCTMGNPQANLLCFMCQSPRIALKDVDTKWEWHPNPQQWLSYDLDAITQIEQAYSANETTVELTAGYFQTRAGYVIDFERMVQISPTGNERPIRRVGNDEIFDAVEFGTEGFEMCVICQFEFEENDDIVKLKVCEGHGFHQACIKNWINLNNKCPLCSTEI